MVIVEEDKAEEDHDVEDEEVEADAVGSGDEEVGAHDIN